MMTREQYMLLKHEIDERMAQTRKQEKAETAEVNDEYELRLHDLGEAYRKQRQALFAERDARRQEISERYKDERRALWAEDCELVGQWRRQLNIGAGEITPPSDGGELHDKEGGIA